MVLGLLLVKEVKTLGLELAVDEGTGETGKELLGGIVALGLACLNSMFSVCPTIDMKRIEERKEKVS